MSGKAMELSRCRETPPCGSPVLDRREHKAWHERVYISDTRASIARGPRYVGMDVDVTDGDDGQPGGSHTPGGEPLG